MSAKSFEQRIMNSVIAGLEHETIQRAFRQHAKTEYIHPLWCVTPEGSVCVMLYGGETRARAQELARQRYNYVRGHKMFERVVLMEEHPLDVALRMQKDIQWMPEKIARARYDRYYKPTWKRT